LFGIYQCILNLNQNKTISIELININSNAVPTSNIDKIHIM